MKTQHLRGLQRAEIDAYALALPRGGVTRGKAVDGYARLGLNAADYLRAFPLESSHGEWLR